LMGAGRTELLEALFGMYPKRMSGQLWIEDQPFRCKNEAGAISAGLALVPEDRKKNGLVPGLDVKSNISLTTLGQMESVGLLNGAKETELATKYINELSIKTSSDRQLAINLSGGNQQKIVLAKWLATKPKVLMLDEPTRGIDIKAKKEIYQLIIKLAEEGLGIIMVSSELPEILAVSDRVLVMSEGAITGEFDIAESTEDSILKAAIPQTI
jgi:ribose transport system ATP-binding protein